MTGQIKIKSALLSVYSKERLEEIARILEKLEVSIISTGGTYDFLTSIGIKSTPIEALTGYPTILGGRVKTLHPKIFGGILWRKEEPSDSKDMEKYGIPSIDLVVVDLYPFEKTVSSTEREEEIIEKIDIGGISLIRAAAKNFNQVLVISSVDHYDELIPLLENKKGVTTLSDRRYFAAQAFNVSSHYDAEIFNYFNRNQNINVFKKSFGKPLHLRYGENPHQEGHFYGNLEKVFTNLHGKELSYNNLVDIDAAIGLIEEFTEPTVAIIKHTNPCGISTRSSLKEAYLDAFACDPVSSFGGIIAANGLIDKETAEAINTLFFEIIIAEGFQDEALFLLKSKKNRIILQKNLFAFPDRQFKSILNGVLEQNKDLSSETEKEFDFVTIKRPSPDETKEMIFANKVVKHLKSNAIALVKNQQLIGCGMGQTSRVDALKQALTKAGAFGFDTHGSVMASDAFFPFSDSVKIAHEAGITAIVQPGGSIRDIDSVNYCNDHNLPMVFTGIRHFKH
jgi:phosphoribosylaminoimidazolecarboxamide formyltransferase/IMP cyclohydrolase